eukprot:GEMP01005479.1.p1 GENE.GEMP01005479.1~~GEMP01005479.1.p1  ORF type:complete len:641 (-),score=202.96 GEMP01005479.1:1840-3762(-)
MENADVIYEGDCVVSTFAGIGFAGYIDACKSIAQFNCPAGVAVDERGDVYVTDLQNRRLRKITVADGVVRTAAGAAVHGCKDGPACEAQFDYPFGVAIRDDGEIILTEVCNRIRAFSPTACSVRTIAGNEAGFSCPSGVAIRADGSTLVADRDNHRVLKVNAGGEVEIVAGDGETGYTDADALTARFRQPTGIAVSSSGDVYVADSGNHCIRKIDARTGIVTTVAGTGKQGWRDGVASVAEFNHPRAVAVAGDGCVYISEWGNHTIRKFDPVDGCVVTLAGVGENGFHNGEGCMAQFNSPSGMAFGHSGVLYVAEHGNHCIRAIVYNPEAELEAVEKELEHEAQEMDALARDIEKAKELTSAAKEELEKTKNAMTSETEQLPEIQNSLKDKRQTLRAVLAQRRAMLQLAKGEVITMGSAKEQQAAELASAKAALDEAQVALNKVATKKSKYAQDLERVDALLRTGDKSAIVRGSCEVGGDGGGSKAAVSEEGSSSTEAKTDTEDDEPNKVARDPLTATLSTDTEEGKPNAGADQAATVESTRAQEKSRQEEEAVKERQDTPGGEQKKDVADSAQVEAHSALARTNWLTLLRDLDAVNATMQEAQRLLDRVMKEKNRLEIAAGLKKHARVAFLDVKEEEGA